MALLIGWAMYWSLSPPDDQQAASELARRQSARERATLRQASEGDADAQADAAFDALVAAGKTQLVPEDLFVNPDPEGFWFVGKPDHDVGVQIPFAPGHQPRQGPDEPPIGENPGFLGAAACQQCHQERHDSFVHTAHHLTSTPAKRETISGSFQPGENQVSTRSDDVSFEMLERDGRFFQRVSFFDWKFEVPFDLVTGSSKMGQSYLYWHGDGLYQMNVSYLSGGAEEGGWVNSPGYVDGDAIYARPIGRRCLECHTTYADVREPQNHFTPQSLILGISCERCHGPGRDHVDFHQQHPQERMGQHISNPQTLTREQRLDICGQCHSGVSRLKGNPYSFRPGDQISDHYHPIDEKLAGGVHTSNQQSRLSASRCFQATEMTCTDCHNPHQNERDRVDLFSQRCLKCHETSHCGMADTVGPRISDNCVDCHMPKRGSDKFWLKTNEGKVFPPLRDHHVRVDQQATDAFLQRLNSDGADAEQ
ncbi:C cytochrome precursor [Stieleria sp. TO1_6]|uniref:multiheme c-type cytochrome n=1 Tax=Stieleria tagensis TaxID=2956795 RepID=UPI00209B7D97|nr:multiheme c-type cytochrome [Stieleria tagensis]MCO8123163.1 C cytochrome precursor [Stieleria tagensis]